MKKADCKTCGVALLKSNKDYSAKQAAVFTELKLDAGSFLKMEDYK